MPPTPEEIRQQREEQAEAELTRAAEVIDEGLAQVIDAVTQGYGHDVAHAALRKVLISHDAIDPKPEKPGIELRITERAIHTKFHQHLDEGMGTMQALARAIGDMPNFAFACRPEFWDYMRHLI